MVCEIREIREIVNTHTNKRKGHKVNLKRIPKGIPAEIWNKAHSEGEVIEEVSIEYKSKFNPHDIWEPAIQAIKLKDGDICLRIVHFKNGRPLRTLLVNYDWMLEDFQPLVSQSTYIKDLLRKLCK